MSEAEKVVREFCEAWGRRDVDELLGYFLPDAVYHNIPIAPAVGHEEIRNILNLFLPAAEHVEFEMLHLASSGNVVHTERVDRFRLEGGTRIELPVAGVFEISEGKIAAWRDYFDLATWTKQTEGGS